MGKSRLKVLYMGTPEFAVPTLRAIHAAGFEVVAVVTVPDKAVGRGQKSMPSPIKAAAESLGLPILQPEKLRDEQFQATIRALNPDIGVVVAFRMLPESVWNMPKLGTVNLHASLLPKYRGAAPINWAIVNGETETGNSTFFLKHEIDTGPLIFREPEPIYAEDTGGSLYERLMNKGATLMVKTLEAIEAGNAPSMPQDSDTEDLPKAPKLTKEDGLLDLNMPAINLHNRVRGFSPWPGTYVMRSGFPVKILKTALLDENHYNIPTGDWLVTDKRIIAGCGNNSCLEVLELQSAGKKAMPTSAFLLGNTW